MRTITLTLLVVLLSLTGCKPSSGDADGLEFDGGTMVDGDVPGDGDSDVGCSDDDNDGVCNEDDLCEAADDNADEDGDGVPDDCDLCPGFVDVPGQEECGPATFCVAEEGAADTDKDGTADECDACPEDAKFSTYNWTTWDAPFNGKVATGIVSGVKVKYASDHEVEATPELANHDAFPAGYGVPNTYPVLRNSLATTNTISFGRPVANPLIAVTSVGDSETDVTVSFDLPIEVEYKENLTAIEAQSFTGREGTAVIRIPGVHTTFTMTFDKLEFYQSIAIGFGGTDGDFDADGIPDTCDYCPGVKGSDPAGCKTK